MPWYITAPSAASFLVAAGYALLGWRISRNEPEAALRLAAVRPVMYAEIEDGKKVMAGARSA